MKIFVAASYSSHVNYSTGEVEPEYKQWLEGQLTVIESFGHEVFCALRVDGYRINADDPAAAYKLDTENIEDCDVFLAYVTDKVSAGVQAEVGYALALKKRVIFAADEGVEHQWFNKAIIAAEQAEVITSPITEDMNPFNT